MKNATGPISILGKPAPGQTLIIRGNGASDPDGIYNSTVQYQWFLNDKIYSAGQTVKVTEDVQGAILTAAMTFEDLKGNPEKLTTTKSVPYTEPRLKTLNVLYTYLLKREPDDAGLRFWADYLEKLESENTPYALAVVIEAFMSSDSYKNETKERIK